MAEAAKNQVISTRPLAKSGVVPAKLDGGKAGADAAEQASVLVAEDGTTIIHHDVVAKIAGMAVREVDGVHALVPFDATQSVSRLAKRMVGRTMRDLGIQVEVGTTQTAVDVRINTVYGVSIVEIASQVRKNVRTRLEDLTGLEVVEVNIEILDLYFAGEDDEPEVSPDAPRVR
jgi:uncharacterized alkaline shock family protein YloU